MRRTRSAVHEAVIRDPRYAAFRQAEGAVAIGIGSDSPHVVEPSLTIKFDMQVDVGGYHSDIGRTYAIDPSADQIELYATLSAALDELLARSGQGPPSPKSTPRAHRPCTGPGIAPSAGVISGTRMV